MASDPAVDGLGPLDGVELALRGLAAVNDWLSAVGDLPTGVVEHHTVQGLLVGLGHIDSAALAALSGSIVLAEETGCARDDGHASPSAWVAQQLRLSSAAAARACRLAGDLDGLPDAVEDLRSGRISRDHAGMLADASRQQRHDQQTAERDRRATERAEADRRAAEVQAQAAAAADEAQRQAVLDGHRRDEQHRREAEAAEATRRAEEAAQARDRRQADLLAAARAGRTPEDVAAENNRRRADDRDALARAEAVQRAARSVRTWIDRDNGSGRGVWSLPIAQHEQVLAALEALRTHDAAECEPDERRTFPQRQADAFTDAFTTVLRTEDLPTSRGQRPHVSATVPLETLTGEGTQPATTRFGSMLSPEAIARLACDAALTRVVLSATSQVLDVGRETRQWTGAQYKAADVRFGGCAFPVGDGRACGRPPSRCDLHHVTFWRHGGRTDARNGVLLCSHHHDAVHHDGWTLDYDHDQQTVTVTRDRRDGTRVRRSVSFARPHRSTGHQAADPPPAREPGLLEPDRLPL